MEHLLEKLKKNSESDMYPYHMPGHKRKGAGHLPEAWYSLDITEIDGFDNLHQPEEILKNLQEQASRIYGSEETFFLVNGSTCGILAAISAALPVGGHILMTRNCHKSAYHAAYLRSLTISYLYPPYLSEYDICDAVTPEQVSAALEENEGIGAVLIVSPTYEGRIANVKEIAEIVHTKGIPLIVDEAHGAHLGMAEGFAKNSCQQGADLVIHSTHKTLPALTQTALLHVNGKLIDRELLRRFLCIYQTSSPSYILMASIDNCLQYVDEQGREAFKHFKEKFTRMCKGLECCRRLKFLPLSANRQDIGKLFISVKDAGISGKLLYDILRVKYHLQLEMAQESYCLAMFTVNDTSEAYKRMEDALLEIDWALGDIPQSEKMRASVYVSTQDGTSENVSKLALEATEKNTRGLVSGQRHKPILEHVHFPMVTAGLPLHEAWNAKSGMLLIQESVGRCVAEFINLYPPGIPLLVPGEIMTAEMCENIFQATEMGLKVQGITCIGEDIQIKVLV